MSKKIGKNWILIRGLARESAHWGDFPNLLQATFYGSSVFTLDLPGTGCHYRDVSPSTISAIVESVRGRANEMGLLQQSVTLLALSLGGIVAWEWMKKYPADICGGILISISFARFNPFYQRLKWQNHIKFLTLMSQHNVYQRELAIVRMVNNSRHLDEQTAIAWEQIHKMRPISLKTIYHQILAAAQYIPSAEKPDQPVLLINSKGDKMVNPVCSETIQRKWDLELRTHPWAGHDLTLDDSEWVLKQLKEWVAKNG